MGVPPAPVRAVHTVHQGMCVWLRACALIHMFAASHHVAPFIRPGAVYCSVAEPPGYLIDAVCAVRAVRGRHPFCPKVWVGVGLGSNTRRQPLSFGPPCLRGPERRRTCWEPVVVGKRAGHGGEEFFVLLTIRLLGTAAHFRLV